MRLQLCTILLPAAVLAGATAPPAAAEVTVPVKVVNDASVKVTNNAQVTVTNTVPVSVSNTVPVTGTVNAAIINTPLPVSGTIGVSALPPVSVVPIPSSPFFGRIDGIGTALAMGANAGTIGVTSIIVNNETGSTQIINFFNAVATDPTLCPNGSGAAIGGAYPYMYFTIEPNKTTQFTFPTPLVFTSVNGGITCIASNLPAGMQLFVSGVTQ